jgi:hypothetical protein
LIVDPELARRRFERDLNPLAADPGLYAVYGVRLLSRQPHAAWVAIKRTDGVELVLYVDGVDYDFRPAGGWWVLANGSLVARVTDVPVNNGFQVPPTPEKLNRTWLCFPGWRDYHDHSGHMDPGWAWYRGQPSYQLPATLLQLATDLDRAGVEFR